MRLIKQHGRKYGNKDYFKYIIVIPNKLIAKLRWKGGEDLEAKERGGKLMIETVSYRVKLYDMNGKQLFSEILNDRDEFLEKADLSETKDNSEDTEVKIVTLERDKSKPFVEINQNKAKAEVYFGKRNWIEKVLKQINK